MGRYVALLRGINVGGKNPIPMKLLKEAFEYYPKLGFKRGYELGLTLPDGSSPDALMAYELKEGSLAGGGVCKFLAPEYGKAEADDITGFHRAFINENYGGKLILRKFFDDDMELFKKWLYLPHISKWYECPDSWIKEVEGRHGKFSFINHFIAEAGGVPIGFCQYYDCYFGQGYEDWHKIERQGEVFSIDYFIGEPLFLGKGLGKGIVSLLTSMVKDKGGKRIIVGPEPDNTPSKARPRGLRLRLRRAGLLYRVLMTIRGIWGFSEGPV